MSIGRAGIIRCGYFFLRQAIIGHKQMDDKHIYIRNPLSEQRKWIETSLNIYPQKVFPSLSLDFLAINEPIHWREIT